MELKENTTFPEKLSIIKECLIDYVGPFLIVGDIDWLLEGENITTISATLPKEEFIIINNQIPNWMIKLEDKNNDENNILVITDMDKIEIEKQEILLDILENNQISTKALPSNLKVILNAKQKCKINNKVRDIIEYYEI